MEVSSKIKTLNRLGVGFVVLFVLMLLLVFVKKGIYSTKMGINIVIVGDTSVALALIRPQEGLLTWVRLPGNLSVKIVSSEAKYPLSSLWKFGVMEKRPYDLVADSLSYTVGVILPRVIKIEGEVSPENLLGQVHKINLGTNLSIRDRILLRKDLIASISSKKIIEIEIPQAATTKSVEPDGREFLEINSVVNLWTKNKFVFDSLLAENQNVKIYNLSSVKGAGLLLSRQLESAGLRVVEVSSNNQTRPVGRGCVYKAYSDESLMTDYFLKNYLRCKSVVSSKEKHSEQLVEVWLL